MRGLSLDDVARALDITERTVYRWERGDTGIPDHHKLALADLLNVSVIWLMGWEDEDNGNGTRAVA